MPRRLACSVACIVSALLLWAAPVTSAEPELPPPLDRLTPELRQRIDRLAARTPLEPLDHEKVNLAGNITAWMLTQAAPTAEEEQQLAAEVHRQNLKLHRTVPTPAAAERVFRRLVDHLPPHLKPAPFTYTLTVLDVPRSLAFTPGGGHVYISKAMLDGLLPDARHGPDALAFVLAQELGHIGYLHCRRGYQLQRLQEDARKGIDAHVDSKLAQMILKTGVNANEPLVKFLYNRVQEYEADLFALMLCRNAGFGVNGSLDCLRWLALWRYPKLATAPDYQPDEKAPSVLAYYLTSHPDPILRLKRLQMELAGQVEGTEYGLFACDRTGEKLARAARLPADDRPAVVFVHGLRGDKDSFLALQRHLAAQAEACDLRLFVFRWPNDSSLARAGAFLRNEMARVFPSAQRVTFVCHSAGGLVFRTYAERHGGAFDRAIFLSTPHGGSDMAALKFLVDVGEFVGDLKLGIPAAVATVIAEGRGEIEHDLRPESLFLRYLGQDEKLTRRYHIFAAECLGTRESLALQLGFGAVRTLLRKPLASSKAEWLNQQAVRLVDNLVLPREVAAGDGAVSVQSASLKGAASVTVLPGLNHQTIKSDPKALDLIARKMLEK
jgi:pimeloyl-ACP methyl ester carboxylesterase